MTPENIIALSKLVHVLLKHKTYICFLILDLQHKSINNAF